MTDFKKEFPGLSNREIYGELAKELAIKKDPSDSQDVDSKLSYSPKTGILCISGEPIYQPQRTKGRKAILDALWKSRKRPKSGITGSYNLKEVLAQIGNFIRNNKYDNQSAKSVEEAIEDIRKKLKNNTAPAHVECNRGYLLVIDD